MVIILTHTSGAKWHINIASIWRYTAVALTTEGADPKVRTAVVFSRNADTETHYFHETPEKIDKLIAKAMGQ